MRLLQGVHLYITFPRHIHSSSRIQYYRYPHTTVLSVLRYNGSIIIGINSTSVNVIYNCRSFMNGVSVLVLTIMVTIPELDTHMSVTVANTFSIRQKMAHFLKVVAEFRQCLEECWKS
jgi:hypothetical protein